MTFYRKKSTRPSCTEVIEIKDCSCFKSKTVTTTEGGLVYTVYNYKDGYNGPIISENFFPKYELSWKEKLELFYNRIIGFFK